MRSDVPVGAVSVTRLRDFLSCRRRGKFEESWSSSKFEANLFFGIAIHEGLEKYYKSGKQVDVMMKAYTDYCAQAAAGYERDLGYLWSESYPEFNDLYHLGWAVLENYADFDKIFPIDGKPLWIERRLSFPMPGISVNLSGQIDVLFEDESGNLWVVDHKTSARGVDPAACDIDEQLTAYAYLVFRETGRVPAGIIYNTIIKQAPEPPVPLTPLKDGTPRFSKAKDQRTTPAKYRAALTAAGLDHGPYEEFIAQLEQTTWGKFFQREVTTRNLTELRAFEEYAPYKIRDIAQSISGTWPEAYPAPSIYQCGYCPFIAPCKAMNDGGDWVSILNGKFKHL